MSAAVLKQEEQRSQEPDDDGQAEIRSPEHELTLAERVDRLLSKELAETSRVDIEAIAKHLTSIEVEAEFRKHDLEKSQPDAVRTLKEDKDRWHKSVKEHLIKCVVEESRWGNVVTRGQLKEMAKRHIEERRFMGKNKNFLRLPTIKRYLTVELEQEIRNAAAALVCADLSDPSTNRHRLRRN